MLSQTVPSKHTASLVIISSAWPLKSVRVEIHRNTSWAMRA